MPKVFSVSTSEAKTSDLSPISEERKEKAERCLFEKDKLLSLSASLALSKGLASFGLDGAKERFGTSERGKPYLIDHPEIHFSLSHSGEMAIAAFDSEEIGCDIERKRPLSKEVLNRCFSEEEKSYVRSSTDKDDAFTRIWVYKESFLKAIGTGIAFDLSSFSALPKGREIVLKQNADPRDWRIEEIKIPGYIAAVCHQSGKR